jgi:hypothetical protein
MEESYDTLIAGMVDDAIDEHETSKRHAKYAKKGFSWELRCGASLLYGRGEPTERDHALVRKGNPADAPVVTTRLAKPSAPATP